MASTPKDTIIVRVKRHTKWAATRAARADRITLTQYIINLINEDQINRDVNGHFTAPPESLDEEPANR